DAVQEAAITALTSLDRLREPDRFGPWLAGIGLNVCRQWLRRRRGDWSWEALQGGLRWDGPLEGSVDPAEAAAEADLAEMVRRAVAGLPPGQRAAVFLFYFGGLTYREVADALGIEVGAVKARLHQGRRALRQQLTSTWRSFTMSEEGQERYVAMRPMHLRRIAGSEGRPDAHVFVLQEVEGERTLAIWIGPSEAIWLAHVLEGVETPRPSPYTLMASVLRASGAVLEEVRVSRLADETFFAELVMTAGGRRTTVDARPSDALNLALRLGAPIAVSEEVLDRVQSTHRISAKGLEVADEAALVAEARAIQERLSVAVKHLVSREES
ncbi:MAG: bifunctional nuclease family protein, partial [Candidatus Dormibacteraeota bacterium]|nr:bifunctional nuclease family protein [Candidatus Dormibacteraeota bacterium]